MKKRVFGFAVLLTGFSTLAMAQNAQPVVSQNTVAPLSTVAPQYTFEECCAICPQAENPANYDSGFLKEFKILKEGEHGWLFRSEADLQETFGPSDERYPELKRFNDTLKAKGVTLVLAYVPTRGLVHGDFLRATEKQHYDIEKARKNFRLTLKKFRDQGIATPDLAKIFDRDHENFFFKKDHHWTTYGAKITADIVAEEIKNLSAYESISKTEYKTHQEGVLRKSGTLQAAYKKLCSYDTSDQVINGFTTELASADGDLFGDSVTEITLVGTSNSKGAMPYNFDGALQENLSADINNVAIASARFDGALLEYLPSEDFQKNPPKIMIWEVPSYYSLDNEMFYRQAIPLIKNGCAGKTAKLSKTTEVSGDNQEILFNGGGEVLPLAGGKHGIDLTFSDPNIKQIDATIWYINGRKDHLKASVAKRVNNNGRFVFELKRDGEWKDMNFLSVDIARLESYGKDLKVNATLCEME